MYFLFNQQLIRQNREKWNQLIRQNREKWNEDEPNLRKKRYHQWCIESGNKEKVKLQMNELSSSKVD